jgi:cytochrome d ubiquinol oxidase subunit I
VVTNHFGWQQYFHTLSGAYILAGFFVMGVSAYHILRRQHLEFFTKSFRFGLIFALIFSVAEVVQGHIHGAKWPRFSLPSWRPWKPSGTPKPMPRKHLF